MLNSLQQHPPRSRVTWVLGTIAAVATMCAVYFASQARHHASAADAAKRALADMSRDLARTHAQSAVDTSQVTAAASEPPPKEATLATPATPAIEAAPRASATADMQAVMRSPAMQEMMRQGRLARLRPMYDPLLTQFPLSPEEHDRFYDLQLRVDDPVVGLDKIPSEAKTPEERTQIEEQIRQKRETALQEIGDLLGGAGYQTYESYRATQSERELVQDFRQQADPRSPPISDWQYDRLRDLLIQSRLQYPRVNDDPSAANAAALTQAAQILTPDQLASFRNYLNNQQEMNAAFKSLVPPGGE